MYWIRTGSTLDLIFFAALAFTWSIGGWLIVAHAFTLHGARRLLAGFTTGLLLWITLVNLLTPFVTLTVAAGLSSALLLLSGLLLASLDVRKARRSGLQRSWLPLSDLRAWPVLAVLALLTLLLTLVGRGLAIFDDYLHIPLVSMMATGDIPPHFFKNPEARFSYHYGLQVLAAGMVGVGGFFPWSAWDISKALAIALTAVLGWVWFQGTTRSRLGAWLGSIFIVFAGGARWLLLLLPVPLLQRVSSQITLSNTAATAGSDLATVLSLPWLIEGAGAFPFPFAFHNGINVPAIFALGSSGAMPLFTVILLLLLANRRRFSLPGAIIFSLLLSNLALSAEHLFVFLLAGIALAIGIYLLTQWRRHHRVEKVLVIQWLGMLIASGLLSLVQGGFLTEAFRHMFLGAQNIATATGEGYSMFSFTPSWPPQIDTAHFGNLSLTNPIQLLVWLIEVGPALALAPLVTMRGIQQIRRRNWLYAGLALASLVSFFIILIFQYGAERSGARLQNTALWLWALMGFPIAWALCMRSQQPGTARRKRRASRQRWLRGALIAGYIIAVVGGLVIFAVQLIAIPAPQLTYFVNSNDARISQANWNRLPTGSTIFDPITMRSVALFGRPTLSGIDLFTTYPEHARFIDQPDALALAQTGYDFVYVTRTWLQDIKSEYQEKLLASCTTVYDEYRTDDGDFRVLLDLRGCR